MTTATPPATRSSSAPRAPSVTSASAALVAEIRAWWADESAGWDGQVAASGSPPLAGGVDLWNSMPLIDSKAVARSSPIFERHLGAPLDVRLIRSGGYASVDDLIADLVPKMEDATRAGN